MGSVLLNCDFVMMSLFLVGMTTSTSYTLTKIFI